MVVQRPRRPPHDLRLVRLPVLVPAPVPGGVLRAAGAGAEPVADGGELPVLRLGAAEVRGADGGQLRLRLPRRPADGARGLRPQAPAVAGGGPLRPPWGAPVGAGSPPPPWAPRPT